MSRLQGDEVFNFALPLFGTQTGSLREGTNDKAADEPSASQPITEQQFRNRMILRNAMLRHGFKPLDSEWWHFTLRNEPYPKTYFNIPVKQL